MQCEGCKNIVDSNSICETECCKRLLCGTFCASPCDSECNYWTCNLGDISKNTCWGSCPEHSTGLITQEQYNGLFTNRENHDAKLDLAISKFSSMGGKHLDLTCFEQLLISEELNIEKNYSQLKGLSLKNPYA